MSTRVIEICTGNEQKKCTAVQVKSQKFTRRHQLHACLIHYIGMYPTIARANQVLPFCTIQSIGQAKLNTKISILSTSCTVLEYA